MAMKRIERLALPQRLSGLYGHLLFAALNNMLKWNHLFRVQPNAHCVFGAKDIDRSHALDRDWSEAGQRRARLEGRPSGVPDSSNPSTYSSR